MEMGYARVSSKDQNPERQIQKFKELQIDDRFIFVDKLSGKDFNRPRYQAMRAMIRAGDVIYIDALDRLGRNYDGVISEWKYITRELNADIVCLDNETLFDSRKFKSMGDFGKVMEDQFLSLLAYVADQQRKNNKKLQADGIEIAKTEGIKFGRPQRVRDASFYPLYLEWKSGKLTAVETMKRLKLKKTTFYRLVGELEEELSARNG